MKRTSPFFALASFLMVGFFFLVGLGFLAFAYCPFCRFNLIRWIGEKGPFFPVLGLIFMAVGIICAVGFHLGQRGRFLRLEMGGGKLLVDQVVVRKQILDFWKKQWPGVALPKEIYCQNGKIEIVSSEKKLPLEQIEKDLGLFLKSALSSDAPFYLTLTTD